MKKELDLSLFGTTTLGALIDALRFGPKDADVQFDFCYLSPTDVASYRGYYDHLALGWTDKHEGPGHWPKASALLANLEAAIGKTFEGWKGGSYRMGRDTPLWVANAGDTGGTGITAIEFEGESTIDLHTAKVD